MTYTEKAKITALSLQTTYKGIEGVFPTVLGRKCDKVELVLLEKLLGWKYTMALHLSISSRSLTLHQSDSLG